LLEFQGLRKFVECRDNYQAWRVKAFYCKLEYADDKKKGVVAKFSKGKIAPLLPDNWVNHFGLEWSGYIFPSDEATKGFDSMAFGREISKTCLGEKAWTQMPVSQLKVEARMLYWVLTKIIDPRKGNFAKVKDEDLPLLWMLWNKRKLNWPQFFCQRMMSVAKDYSKPIVFGSQVSRVLSVNGCYSRVTLTEPSSDHALTLRIIHKMHYYEDKDKNGRIVEWYYREPKDSPLKIYDDRILDVTTGRITRAPRGLAFVPNEFEEPDDVADEEDRIFGDHVDEDDEDYEPQQEDKFESLKNFMVERFDRMETYISENFTAMNGRFDELDRRFEALTSQINNLNFQTSTLDTSGFDISPNTFFTNQQPHSSSHHDQNN
jgi:hypothetical protein